MPEPTESHPTLRLRPKRKKLLSLSQFVLDESPSKPLTEVTPSPTRSYRKGIEHNGHLDEVVGSGKKARLEEDDQCASVKLDIDLSPIKPQLTRLKYDEDPILVDAVDTADYPMTGFENLGNTCYLNSVLQALRATPNMVDIAAQYEDTITAFMKNTPDETLNRDVWEKHELALAVSQVIHQADVLNRAGVCSPISPYDICKCMQQVNCLFERYQQDANEALSTLLHSFLTIEEFYTNLAHSKLKHSFTKSFTGTMTLVTKCEDCLTVSRRDDVFLESRVPLSKPHSTSNLPFIKVENEDSEREFKNESNSENWMIDNCLMTERLTGRNKYKCVECQTYTEAWRTSHLKTLPPFMIFQLLRFKSPDSKEVSCPTLKFKQRKVKEIQKGDDWLDGSQDLIKLKTIKPILLRLKCFEPACLQERGQFSECHNLTHEYELYAIVVHIGGTISRGHYIAYTKQANTPSDIMWRRCDDSNTAEGICEDKLIEKLASEYETPYLLFYKSCAN